MWNENNASLAVSSNFGCVRWQTWEMNKENLETPVLAWGGFLKSIPIGIPTYTGMKTGFHADVSPRESGFRDGVGQNADWNNL